jgi:hypothetical protein
MSTAALDAYELQKKAILETGNSSEQFQIVGGGISGLFYGIFDQFHIEDNEDKGHVAQKQLTTLIMCNNAPVGLIPRTSRIERLRTHIVYKFNIALPEEEGVTILCLV